MGRFIHSIKYFKILVVGLLCITFLQVFSQQFQYPVDIAFHETTGKFYVSNWANGNGFIVKMNNSGVIESIFFQGLHYTGGLCIIDDIVYVVYNTGLYNTGLPCFLKGINIYSGSEVLYIQIADGGAYLDKVIKGPDEKLFISDSGLGKIYSYDLVSNEISTIAEPGSSKFLYSICYDEYDDRIVFTYSSFTSSFIKSVRPDGGEITNLAFYDGYLENLIMEVDGDFYVSSWGKDYVFGNEYIFRYNHTFTDSITASTAQNRPFGMYKNEATNELIACNWGDHSIRFIDLTPIGIKEIYETLSLKIFPLPASDFIHVEMPQEYASDFQFEIINMQGKTMISQEITSCVNGNSFKTDICDLTDGIYIAQTKNSGTIYRTKFVVKH